MPALLILMIVFAAQVSGGGHWQESKIDYMHLPERAAKYIPELYTQIDDFWPDMPARSVLCAQIEQETCITLKNASCWSPYAKLRTSREEGRGLGQITRAWDKKGNLRFDSLGELKEKHSKELAGWSWRNVDVSFFQLRAVVLKNKDLYDAATFAETEIDRLAFMDAAYNGGWGGLMSDRNVCKATAGCNPNVWRGNVEKTSKKAKVPASGYGKGFFYINREHVREVVYGIEEGELSSRRARYQNAGIK